MHKFDDKVARILLNVLSHTIERLSLDPPTLDNSRTVDFFNENAKCLICEEGNPIETVFNQYKSSVGRKA